MSENTVLETRTLPSRDEVEERCVTSDPEPAQCRPLDWYTTSTSKPALKARL